MQLAVQSVSALFPANRSLVMASLSGAFQAASGIYLLFEVLHGAGGISRSALLLIHAAIAFAISLSSLLTWPNVAFGLNSKVPTTAAEQPALATTAVGAPAATAATAAGAAAVAAPSTAATPRLARLPLKERGFRAQVRSTEFLLLLTYFSCNALQCQFTVGTIGVQFELKGDESALSAAGEMMVHPRSAQPESEPEPRRCNGRRDDARLLTLPLTVIRLHPRDRYGPRAARCALALANPHPRPYLHPQPLSAPHIPTQGPPSIGSASRLSSQASTRFCSVCQPSCSWTRSVRRSSRASCTHRDASGCGPPFSPSLAPPLASATMGSWRAAV